MQNDNDIRIGTSGFSYDDWKGFFYPATIEKGEMLGYYSRHFRTVEVNSSYYAIPSPFTFQRMSEKTPLGFDFVVKAHKDLTHSTDVDTSIFGRFADAVQPLVESGKMGCILAQYPWSFKRSPENADRLRQLRGEMEGLPIVIEFRNYTWVDEGTYELLRDLDLGFCCVDEPRIKGLMPRVAVATSSIGYVRFHGRNSDNWWNHQHAWQRYDYLYTRAELQEWKPRVEQIAAEVERTYLFFNNHYKGKAAQNAQVFAAMLDIPLPLTGIEHAESDRLSETPGVVAGTSDLWGDPPSE